MRMLLSHVQVDKVTLESVVNDWAGAVLRLVTLMPGHPAVQRDLPGLCAQYCLQIIWLNARYHQDMCRPTCAQPLPTPAFTVSMPRASNACCS